VVGPVGLVTSTEATDGKVVVSVQGDVDLASSDELRRALDKALLISPQVEIDLTGLTFIDSSGLSALVEAHRKARDAGGVLVLRNPTPMLSRLLDITRLDTLLVTGTSETGATDDVTNDDEA
jgi:anti-sigma B factor antagonist